MQKKLLHINIFLNVDELASYHHQRHSIQIPFHLWHFDIYKCTLNDVMIQEIDSLSIKNAKHMEICICIYHLINVFGHENGMEIFNIFILELVLETLLIEASDENSNRIFEFCQNKSKDTYSIPFTYL